MAALRFAPAFLRLFSGPLVWAAHFAVIYGFTGYACARRLHAAGWLGIGVIGWVVIAATLAAAAAVFALSVWTGGRAPPQDSASFSRWTGAALGLLSMVAIVWEAMPILLVPACA